MYTIDTIMDQVCCAIAGDPTKFNRDELRPDVSVHCMALGTQVCKLGRLSLLLVFNELKREDDELCSTRSTISRRNSLFDVTTPFVSRSLPAVQPVL